MARPEFQKRDDKKIHLLHVEKEIFFFSFLVTYWYFTILLNNFGSSRGFPAFLQSQGIPILKTAYSRADFGRTGLNMRTILLQTHKDFYSKQCCTLQNCKLLLKFILFFVQNQHAFPQRIKVFHVRE